VAMARSRVAYIRGGLVLASATLAILLLRSRSRCKAPKRAYDSLAFAANAGTLPDPPTVSAEEPLVGVELAQRLAKTLQAKFGNDNRFGYVHRDYCGDTVFFQDGTFYVAPMSGDGYPPQTGSSYYSFGSEGEFVDWIATQSDAIFSGRGEGPLHKDGDWYDNQTLSIARIREYRDEFFPEGLMVVIFEVDEEGEIHAKLKATGKLIASAIDRLIDQDCNGVKTVDGFVDYLETHYPGQTFEFVLPDGATVDRTTPLKHLKP